MSGEGCAALGLDEEGEPVDRQRRMGEIGEMAAELARAWPAPRLGRAPGRVSVMWKRNSSMT